MSAGKDIFVYLDLQDFAAPLLIGILHSEVIRGKEVFSFSADTKWLSHTELYGIDPELLPFQGRQYPRDGKTNFGLLLDSAPDRWGRNLIKRREAIAAKQEKRPPRPLYESDFLFSVYDGSRMGALRLKREPAGDFLDTGTALSIPPWTSIRDLEYTSLQLERDNATDTEYAKWLTMLVNPGSSLGGARPKANVVDRNGQLWIAKFPSGSDEKDIGAWEQVANALAAQCGIQTPETRAERFSSKQHTFLTRRFDRSASGRRIHVASAMTLLGEKDGADYTQGISYLDVAGIITRLSADVDANLEELWRRMVFNIAISNCDDHLRNHGFLLTPSGWILSPVYDINPDENGTGLKLNISEDDNSLDFDAAMAVIPYFRLSSAKAKQILDTVKNAVSQWRRIAETQGISRMEQEMVSPAFQRHVSLPSMSS
ncbi:MAG: HipA domain-containing protein [Treponema sp.]|jgi:serine/threonine-protein kinase HipA|nr:HipA domain-containing protein [Treponema sp.]